MKRTIIVLSIVFISLLFIGGLVAFADSYGSEQQPAERIARDASIDINAPSPVPFIVDPEPEDAPAGVTVHSLLLPHNGTAEITMAMTAGDIMVSFMLVLCLAVLLFNTALGVRRNV